MFLKNIKMNVILRVKVRLYILDLPICFVALPYLAIFELVCSVDSPVVRQAPFIQWPEYKI